MSEHVADEAATAAVDYDPFGGAAISRVVPTTEAQREIWLADRLGRDASLSYNESVSLGLGGALDVAALRAALADLAERHEALRSTLGPDGETLCIAGEASLEVPLLDHGALPPAERGAALERARRSAVETPFDLERGPLVRAEIHRLAPDQHVVLLTLHHIVCDGWSFAVLARDLGALYAHRVGARADAPPQCAQYGDYAVSQGDFNGSTDFVADEAFWLSRFAGPVPALDLPTDRPRAAWRTFTSRRIDYSLEPALVADVRRTAARQGAGFFGALLGAFAGMLHRITGADDVVVGVPAAGQSQEGFGDVVGHCVNILPVRLAVDGHASAGALFKSTQGSLLDALEHQRYTFGTLLKKLALARDPSRLPLVSVVFNLDQALDADALGFPNLRATFASNPRAYENFELFINAVQISGGLTLECQYNTDLFDEATVRRWLACLEALLRGACTAPDAALDALDIVPEGDRRRLEAWNATAADYPREALAHELFEATARRAAARVAVRFRETAFTYAELDAQANRIAQALRARGVGRGALVGLHVRRSGAMLAAMLGVLKAGAGYVPLDPTYPADRLQFMATDARLAVLVSEAAIEPALDWPADRRLLLDADAAALAALPAAALPRDERSATPLDVAYVIYTSGSTGKPKGVRVPHRAVVNFLHAMARAPGLTEADRIVAVTTLSFDIAVNELLLPLSVGADIALAAPEESGDGAILQKLLATRSATVMQATPATWRLLLEAGWSGATGLRALCGGEPLAPDLAKELLGRTTELWNLYGPTETTVWSTACRVTDAAAISIGRPIANTTVWVLDESSRPCPIGVPGEIWIGGDGVTLGYLDRPELTAERFVADPFSATPGARLYRTGDRGRWRDDGTLEHMGRLDFQVKVRGYRIELGEIEAALATHPGVAQAVAMAREDRPGDVRLVAYVVARAGSVIEEAGLTQHLKGTLPEYMIPQHLVPLPAIPRLPNGKVDRKALPAPQAAAPARDYVAPRDDLERAVAREMEASLGLPGVGIHDDFFRLGGHSLLAAQLTGRLNRALGTQLTMRTLFAAPTIARLAAAVRAEAAAPARPERKPITHLADRSQAPASLMQERLWYLNELSPGRVTYHTPSTHRLTGTLDEAAFERAFREMVRRQAALRTSFEAHGGTVMQRIHDEVPIRIFPVEDLSGVPAERREERLRERVDQLILETFDLTQAPLFKTRMFRLGPQEHAFFFMAHHMVWDGWSFDLLYSEMSALYAAFVEGRESPLEELPVTYGDFAAWHREWSQGPEAEAQVEFWRKRLAAIDQVGELPTDKPRRPGMSGEGSTELMWVDIPRTQALHELSRRSSTTVYVTTLAIYCALLHGFSGQSRLLLGTPVRGRNALEVEGIMGYFNNLVPLPLEVDPSKSFLELVEHVKAMVVDCFAHPDIPLERLARELSVTRGSGGTLLYQALFSFQDTRQRITQWGPLAHGVIPVRLRGATEDLGMWFAETAKGLRGAVTYNSDILSLETAQGLRRDYLALLDAVLAAPDAPVSKLVGPEGANVRVLQPAPKAATPARPAATAADTPTTETEKSLAAIWCEQLKLPAVSTTDNFFDLGGHSLIAIQAILAMEAKTGKRIERGRYLFETLGQIARAYDEAAPEPAAKPGKLRGLFSGILGRKTS